MAETKKRYVYDGSYLVDEGEKKGQTVYVRSWREGKGRNAEIIVQVWLSGKPEGDPDGDWGIPGVFGLEGAVAQAVIQTDPKA